MGFSRFVIVTISETVLSLPDPFDDMLHMHLCSPYAFLAASCCSAALGIGGGGRYSLMTPASQFGTEGVARMPHDSSSNVRETLPTGAPRLGGKQIDTTSRSRRLPETRKAVHDLSRSTRLNRSGARRPTQQSHARSSAPVSRLRKGCFNVF